MHIGTTTGILVYYPPEVRRGAVGSIPVSILYSCQDMKLLHYNCIIMKKVGKYKIWEKGPIGNVLFILDILFPVTMVTC